MSERRDRARAAELLEQHGRTFADEAGIRLRDTPAPLYQLSVLSMLSSAPIRAHTAIATARELFAAGWRTPARMAKSTWQQRVDALGRGGYRRYDESTSTALGEGAQLILDSWSGDLRKLRAEAGGDPAAIRERLRRLPRIGPTGADIFCREAQGIWPELRPAFDKRALDGARADGLPAAPEKLAALVAPDDLPRLAAALVRATL
jgi:hypothetical protein